MVKNMLSIDQLNQQFAQPDHLYFAAGAGQRPAAFLRWDGSETAVSLFGAHVLSYKPAGQAPLLWLSKFAQFKPDKAIRGGIPLVWPWFGSHPADSHKPSHGFARISQWQVGQTAVTAQGTQLHLTLSSSAKTDLLWPHPFHLELIVTLADVLRIALVTKNVGERPFSYSQALHTYFAVNHSHQVQIQGLDGCTFIDKLANNGRFVQDGSLTITQETDRIYLDTPDIIWLDDVGGQRRIKIQSEGSRSAVVWNPWVDKAQRMADFGDSEYQQMICIETANVADDQITLSPGAAHSLTAVISGIPTHE